MRLCNLAVAIVAASLGALAHAQAWPDKPVKFVVAAGPGSSLDTLARVIGERLRDKLGQSVVVENKPAAGGTVATAEVAKAAPDGYTMLVGSIGVFAINPALFKNLPYQPMRDFDLITLAVTTPNILVATPKFPAGSVAELIAYAKRNPGRVSFVSSGTGSSDHLSAELFWQRTGTTGIHVPYKGGSAAMTDLIGGAADVSFQNLGAASGHIRSGRLKALAVTSAKRVPQFPDVPTVIEAGIPGFEVYSWQAVVSPKGVPRAIAAKLHAAVTGALRHPENRPRLEAQGFDVVAGSSADFEQFLKNELARWKSVVDTAGVKPE
jgi:tripartite-type tricarboxylate transporter receptor subunit TctC